MGFTAIRCDAGQNARAVIWTGADINTSHSVTDSVN